MTDDGYQSNPLYRQAAAMLDRARISYRVERTKEHFFIVATVRDEDFWRPIHMGSSNSSWNIRKSLAAFKKIVAAKTDMAAFRELRDGNAAKGAPKTAVEDNTPIEPFRLGELVPMDGEPRVKDLDIAVRLGMAQPRNIRQVIEANESEIEMHGEVCTSRVQTSERGGRPAKEYWLNEQQALLVCMFSRTERAAAVRKSLIDVFMAWRKGGLRPVAPNVITITSEQAEEFSRMFGMCKSLMHKVTMIEKRIDAQPLAPTFDLLSSVTALDLARMAGLGDKQRASGLTGAITRKIKPWLAARGVVHIRTPDDLNASMPWRFPRDAATEWLHKHGGADWIRTENSTRHFRAKKSGAQGHLKLITPSISANSGDGANHAAE